MSESTLSTIDGQLPAKKDNKKDKKKVVKKDIKPTKDEIREKKVSKHVARLKEEIARRKEEEERSKKEEEEEERRIQEEIRLAEEKKRIETERKDKRKQKEKERRQRLKDEGKFLTEKQKEDKRKIIELLQSRGLDPEAQKVVNKRPQYSKLKKKPVLSIIKDIDETSPIETLQSSDISPVNDEVLDDWELLAEDTPAYAQNNELSESENETLVICDNPDIYIVENVKHSDCIDNDLTESEQERLIKEAKEHIEAQKQYFEKLLDIKKLREAVICVLGHVDTGKTKILDKLRNSNVQDREAGGITQQIGATNVPSCNIISATQMCHYFNPKELDLPGLLIIDTPGHESFSNLRVRGSSLCDCAILVVDLMHGLEEQTKESIRILKSQKTPFVVALNKVDRLYEWQSFPNMPIQEVLEKQNVITLDDLNKRMKQVVQDFALMEINVELFFKNDADDYVSMVPTSAHTGDGMGDLMAFLCSFLQSNMRKRLAFSEELKASVMEVKETQGLGTTLDVVIVNGRICEGDTIVVAGQEGPITSQVRAILKPAPMCELRVKNSYQHFTQVTGAQGVKIVAKDLEMALAGLPLYIARTVGEELYFKEELKHGLKAALKAISVTSIGVYVVASTLGSLESLLVYLKSVDIPYSGISIGTIHKKDVMKASIMVERELKWAVILGFDVKVDRDAQRMAQELGVRIFTSEIIYDLQKRMEEYVEDLVKDNRLRHRDEAVFPVKLKILPEMIFNKRAPIVMGVIVEAGLLRQGTPICVPTRDNICLGRVFSIEFDHKPLDVAHAGKEICIRIDPIKGETPKLYGRHFDHTDTLISKISRESINVVKEFFRNDLNKDDWKLMVELKKMLCII